MLRKLAPQWTVESAGTRAYNGHRADPNSAEIAAVHGLDLSQHTTRRVADEDFHEFDLIIALDASIATDLQLAAPPSARDRIVSLTDSKGKALEVPDPYIISGGFQDMYDFLLDPLRRFVAHHKKV